jgi:hypothetical protein
VETGRDKRAPRHGIADFASRRPGFNGHVPEQGLAYRVWRDVSFDQTMNQGFPYRGGVQRGLTTRAGSPGDNGGNDAEREPGVADPAG